MTSATRYGTNVAEMKERSLVETFLQNRAEIATITMGTRRDAEAKVKKVANEKISPPKRLSDILLSELSERMNRSRAVVVKMPTVDSM